jgi:hypothetical protein
MHATALPPVTNTRRISAFWICSSLRSRADQRPALLQCGPSSIEHVMSERCEWKQGETNVHWHCPIIYLM